MTKDRTQATKDALRARRAPEPPPVDGLSSGLTLVNLACSGQPHFAFVPGGHYLLVGDSASGKTWLLNQIMAEAARNRAFRKHRLIYGNAERGALMDRPAFFGEALVNRLEETCPATLEEFYDEVGAAAAKGPFIYGLDSEDALSAAADLKKARDDRRARGKGEEGRGSYGTSKAKVNSSALRVAYNQLAEHGSILFMIKQTRDNIGFDAMFNPKTRSGGRALTFYANLELWFSIAGKIKRTAGGKTEVIGSRLKVHVKKNRVSGRDRSVMVPFYPTAGLDETGSLVEFLVDRGHWEANKERTRVAAPEFRHEGTVERLVAKIEAEGLERDLRQIAVDVWRDIEAACAVNRKARYQ